MNDWKQEELTEFIAQNGTGCVYLYTPFCGTCQVASKMLMVVEEIMPDLAMGKLNLNYRQDLANDWKIESVPCLVFIKNGSIQSKLYTFQSVPNVIEKIKEYL